MWFFAFPATHACLFHEQAFDGQKSLFLYILSSQVSASKSQCMPETFAPVISPQGLVKAKAGNVLVDKRAPER